MWSTKNWQPTNYRESTMHDKNQINDWSSHFLCGWQNIAFRGHCDEGPYGNFQAHSQPFVFRRGYSAHEDSLCTQHNKTVQIELVTNRGDIIWNKILTKFWQTTFFPSIIAEEATEEATDVSSSQFAFAMLKVATRKIHCFSCLVLPISDIISKLAVW